MFVIDGDAAVRAEQALVHKTSRAKTGGVINLTYVLAISSTDLGSMDVFARNPFIESIFTVRQLTFDRSRVC